MHCVSHTHVSAHPGFMSLQHCSESQCLSYRLGGLCDSLLLLELVNSPAAQAHPPTPLVSFLKSTALILLPSLFSFLYLLPSRARR